jgi:RIO kinase 2
MDLMVRLARCGLVHCDFNEFNMFIDEDDSITIIDFPQMVSVDHPNAAALFDRDTQCLRVFFERRFGFIASDVPSIAIDCSERLESLDNAVKASGFDSEHQRRLEEALAILGVDMAEKRENEACGAGVHSGDSDEDSNTADGDDEARELGSALGTEQEEDFAADADKGISTGSSDSNLESDDGVEDIPSEEFAGVLLPLRYVSADVECDVDEYRNECSAAAPRNCRSPRSQGSSLKLAVRRQRRFE